MMIWLINLFNIKKNYIMEYIDSILWYISWPVFLIVSYQLVKYAIKKLNYLND